MLTFFFEKTSKYAGVTRNHKASTKNQWQAKLNAFGITHCLGLFETEIEAAKAVNAACKKYNKPIPVKNTELSDEEEEKISWPEIFNKPSENITWANFLTTSKKH